MLNLSSHTISMFYPKRGEYKIGVMPPFLDELKAAIIRWFITPSCHHSCEMEQQKNVLILIKCSNHARYLQINCNFAHESVL